MVQERTSRQCPYCGEDISINAKKCKHCGEWLTEKPIIQPYTQPVVRQRVPKQRTYQPSSQHQFVVNNVDHRSNGVGTAGFVIALICAFLSWLPGVNFLLWFIGLLLSFIGMFKRPRGLAIVGFIISIIDIILIVALVGAIGGLLSGIFN